VIIPLWAPFALLAAVCAVVPRPAWMRDVDWVFAGVWLTIIVSGVCFWLGVVWLIEAAVS
jgi:di/tricarboxylate transporter